MFSVTAWTCNTILKFMKRLGIEGSRVRSVTIAVGVGVGVDGGIRVRRQERRSCVVSKQFVAVHIVERVG